MSKPRGRLFTRKALIVILIIAIILVGTYVALAYYIYPAPTLVTHENYSPEFVSNRQDLANWIIGKYNSTYELVAGADLGGCAYQANAFELLPDNFLAGKALEPYNASLAALIANSTDKYLKEVSYANNDRREVLFGDAINYPPFNSQQITISGSPPSSCPSKTSFWIATEWPNQSSPATSLTGMGLLVTALLEKYREGNIPAAQSLFNIALGWWKYDSTYKGGFLSQASQKSGFLTRDICYFLFAQRATRFPVSKTILNQTETRLWSLQNKSGDGGLAVAYSYDGTVPNATDHSNVLTNSLCLLAYDSRIQTTWWPASQAGQGGSPSYILFGIVVEIREMAYKVHQ